MTQEELDALMNSDLDSDDTLESETMTEVETQSDETQEEKIEDVKVADYRPNPNLAWPPPPPSQEHKVVHQLDDVTKDSEQKATEMMEKLENINNFFADSESLIADINKILDKNIEIFTKLNEKFPNVESFCEALETNKKAKKTSSDIVDHLQGGQDEVMMAMDAMQYQDIHRQKIERVINVMRALSRYMSSLFEGKIDDRKRVGSAVHIEGDSTAEVVSNDDIEALIASLGQK
ncbi:MULTISPECIES: chemotaxis protein [Campylobacter]|uniref:Chemotaxis protein n=1 Tax=Campylobacter molothri TaxID=1032242 RepID=A0ACC5W2E5_9BACT|nr:chemotaxis protein [Campylobacter sp. RM10537]MBZ7929057.1 chemotaxis protein [Campylobacter sp. RM10542]MBZ7930509.1 chemotaxis protein [Campylobacter sp. W0067]MBZ7931487.1 chemotaxis protein [Campylobacter sp. RM12910]MBZ7944310.1 chemotaxis protein [Campylobacter sp. RM13744]MBZ7950196.1 chemotaxis protein [Campylobacter sp. RM10534]MBZ7958898.1 chemotaxis protein [Campylobacter sp. RM9760]MBZ7961840.1 chemotaxis protein [Campylobacter sp. RM9930]MBZ7963269.1 chemotaxis protein [Camp